MPDSIFQENTQGFELTEWKYKNGDDLQWGLPSFNDSEWQIVHIDDFDSIFIGTGWFRSEIIFDSSFSSQSLSFILLQTGASELYLDGHLLKQNGIVADSYEKEMRWETRGTPIAFNYSTAKAHTIAIRYSNYDKEHSYSSRGKNTRGFTLRIVNTNESFLSEIITSIYTGSLCMILTTFFLTLGLLHLLIYLYYRKNKSNIYYFFFALILGMFPLCIFITYSTNSFTVSWLSNSIIMLLFPIMFISLLSLLNSIFYEKFLKRFKWQLIAAVALDVYFFFQGPQTDVLLYLFLSYFSIETFVIIIQAVRKKRKGAKIIGAGVAFFIGFIILTLGFITFAAATNNNIDLSDSIAVLLVFIAIFLSVISIPVSMSIYLAKDFAQTNIHLEKKLIEVEELSAKSMEQEKEKQKILETQKEVLEVQVKERTSEIEEQKKLIEEKNKDITDSINYAKRIQEALLPEQSSLISLFSDSFILFKPKDIVSGDFYWFMENKGKKIIVAADCTGHGVPGALMSMIGCNILNKIILDEGITQPDLILDRLNEEVRTALKQKENASETRDGMDIAIITITNNELQYAGAHRPLYIIANNELNEIKANKFSIGGIQEEKRTFTNHVLTLQKNDAVYLSSDGYADQFGGKTGKKLMTKNFKELLLKIHNDSMKTQKEFLSKSIEDWRGAREQVDDILVIGIKI